MADALERTGHHGGCAEVHFLIQAQRQGPEAIRGGTMRTARTRSNSMPTSKTDSTVNRLTLAVVVADCWKAWRSTDVPDSH